MSRLLELQDATFSYCGETEREVLRQFSFTLNAGERIAIFGPNGCGKTTLLYVLAGFLSLDKGLLKGKSRRLAFLFQDYSRSLFNWFSVGRNLTLALGDDISRETLEEKLKWLLGEAAPIWLPLVLEKYPYQLSGGQRQILCLIRAILTEPDFMLLDEPFSSLDTSHKALAVQLLANLVKKSDAGWMAISHNLDDCMLIADRVLVVKGPPLALASSVRIPVGWPRSSGALLSTEIKQARDQIYEAIWSDPHTKVR
jgi:NitT/TauT family transport system ATP-binding protein